MPGQNKLEQLRAMTDVVADTGDINAIRQYRPLDATTNPSLILAASQLPEYQGLVRRAVQKTVATSQSSQQQLADAVTRIGVDIGLEILKLVPGRVSTEVDARLSFDTRGTIEQARKIMRLYNAAGIGNHRVLIKIASTWEGIRAAQVLEREGISCNLTLLFGFTQAAACADAGATLISPFVGRILDWYKARSPDADFSAHNDPGVISVTRIYNYYKQHGYGTVVMGASFRNTQQIEALAGCDRLTISPALLKALEEDSGSLMRSLSPSTGSVEMRQPPDERLFRWSLNEDAMATEKLAEGIRAFARDLSSLENALQHDLAH